MEITFSKNVFIPLTNSCRNHCAYCGFRSSKPEIMNRKEVLDILKSGKKAGCKEALFTFGEKPEVEPEIKTRLKKWGYSNIVEYLYDLCEDALGTGLLPHSNLGVIEKEDMKCLKEVNASMGLMLENSSERLCKKGMPHQYSPGKHPKERIKVIKNAGELKIPFTTGILIGIGETRQEIADSLRVIKKLNDKHDHIQEVIIQNFKPKRGTQMEKFPEPTLEAMLYAIKTAKVLMPEMNIQISPNLSPDNWEIFLLYGANDLGGISPVTKDYINPEADWPRIEDIKRSTKRLGMTLRERPPIYPKFIKKKWYSNRLKDLIKGYVNGEGLCTC